MSMSIGHLMTLVGAIAAQAGTGTLKDRRAYSSGSFIVHVDGRAVASVSSFSGGGASASAVVDALAAAGYPKKRPGPVTYEDIDLSVGAALDPVLAAWVSDTVNKAQPIHKSGHITMVDATGKEHSRTTWSSGFLGRITFPRLDGASKDAALIQLGITPASTEFSMAGAGQADAGAAVTKTALKKAIVANFRIKIDGLDLSRVARIEPLSLEFKTASAPGKEALRREKAAGRIDVSNLVFSVDASRAEDIHKWHEDFIVKGRNGDENEKRGTLELLSPTLEPILELRLGGIGVLKVEPEESTGEAVRRLRVEAYVESLELKVH
jgi:hypothetical protein